MGAFLKKLESLGSDNFYTNRLDIILFACLRHFFTNR